MVDTELSEKQIHDGMKLINALDGTKEKELKPDAAFWFYYPEVKNWKLMLAMRRLRELGPKLIYQQIQSILSRKEVPAKYRIVSPEYTISLEDIVLLHPEADLIKLLRSAIKTDHEIIGAIRFRQNVINGVMIEDAYIYRL